MALNDEREQQWIDAWSDLYEIIRNRRDVVCQLPDWSIVSVEDCKGWLQESAYLGFHLLVEAGWVGHHRGVIARRWSDSASESTE